MEYGVKKRITGVVFFFLWRAFKALYRCDSRVKAELDSWPDGLTLHMQAGKDGAPPGGEADGGRTSAG